MVFVSELWNLKYYFYYLISSNNDLTFTNHHFKEVYLDNKKEFSQINQYKQTSF